MTQERALEFSVILTLFGVAITGLLGMAGLGNDWLLWFLRLGSW